VARLSPLQRDGLTRLAGGNNGVLGQERRLQQFTAFAATLPPAQRQQLLGAGLLVPAAAMAGLPALFPPRSAGEPPQPYRLRLVTQHLPPDPAAVPAVLRAMVRLIRAGRSSPAGDALRFSLSIPLLPEPFEPR
jgi:hypothetical protein